MNYEKRKNNFEEFLSKINYELVGEYVDQETETKVKHLECGLEYYTKPHTIKRNNNAGFCPNCNFTKNQTFENLKFKLEKYCQGEYTIKESDFKGFNQKMIFTHKCGYEVILTPTNLIKNNIIKRKRKFVCKNCSGYNIKTKDVKKEIYDLVGS